MKLKISFYQDDDGKYNVFFAHPETDAKATVKDMCAYTREFSFKERQKMITEEFKKFCHGNGIICKAETLPYQTQQALEATEWNWMDIQNAPSTVILDNALRGMGIIGFGDIVWDTINSLKEWDERAI